MEKQETTTTIHFRTDVHLYQVKCSDGYIFGHYSTEGEADEAAKRAATGGYRKQGRRYPFLPAATAAA